MSDIYSSEDYRDYLRNVLNVLPTKGAKSLLAKKLKCNPAFISRVLSGVAHLNQEHVLVVSDFLGHSKRERNYFLDLHQYSRASTEALKHHYEERLNIARQRRGKISSRINFGDELLAEQKEKYYSHWIYSAVHLLVLIEGVDSELAVAKYTERPLAEIHEAVEFLLKANLLEMKDGRLSVTSRHLHLGSKSPYVAKHHGNWRLRAMEEFHRQKDSSLHFSGPITMSKKKGKEIKERLLDFTATLLRELPQEKDEKAFCLNFDFFEL